MNNFDHYAAARSLTSQLIELGYALDAAALTSAMEAGATGTEIFMELQFRLAEIIQRVPLKGEPQWLALRLLAELKEALE
jgi:hypothetical protein